MDFKYKHQIEKELRVFFKEKKNEAKMTSPELLDAVNRLEEFTLRGGKRIRAVLIVVGYLAAGGKNIKEIVRLSISAELLHSFLLIHDDVMDEDLLRRNGPSLHASYFNKYDKKTSENIAIDTGDIGFCYAVEPILNSKFDNKKRMIALEELMKIVKLTCYGQMLDIIGETKNVDEGYVRKIHEYKTAKYTISGPLILGAKIAGANIRLIKQLDIFGTKVGKAFQLKDDILGVFGDEKELGKPIGSDLVQGKKTLLVLKANSKYINSKIGTRLTKKEIDKIREIIIHSGSLDYSEKLVKRLLGEASKDLSKIRIRKKEKEFLFEVIEFLGKRKA